MFHPNAAAAFGEGLGAIANPAAAITGTVINSMQFQAGQISGGEFVYDEGTYVAAWAASLEFTPLGGAAVYGVLKTAQYYYPVFQQWQNEQYQNGMQGMPVTPYDIGDWPQLPH